VPEGLDERALLADSMRVHEAAMTGGGGRSITLELIMSEACNFRCTYCIHFNNLETSDRLDDTRKFMTFETAAQIVDSFLCILRQNGKATAEINFGGGEPLLAWPVIHRVLAYCMEHYAKEFNFRFSINTNASLITPEIAAVFKAYAVEIAVSLDGLKKANDLVRITNAGAGTFDRIIGGLDRLSDGGYPVDGIAVTVNERNFPDL
jgi:uncharacterized protein